MGNVIKANLGRSGIGEQRGSKELQLSSSHREGSKSQVGWTRRPLEFIHETSVIFAKSMPILLCPCDRRENGDVIVCFGRVCF